ncbi:MAG: hypothetical protein M1820_008798 [Bogoriella megaspora]|nr:MAG: hypothetical protein M1820_008798 [Bogoriella megaspora]
MSSTKDNLKGLSEKDVTNIAYMVVCAEDKEFKVDVARFARMTGYTEGSARVTVNGIKRKLKNMVEDAEANAGSSPGNGSASASIKAFNPVNKAGEGGDDSNSASGTKKRARKSGTAAKAGDQDDDEGTPKKKRVQKKSPKSGDDGAETDTPKKKPGRKGKATNMDKEDGYDFVDEEAESIFKDALEAPDPNDPFRNGTFAI